MKKLLALTALALTLASCGGSSTNGGDNTTTHEGEGFTVSVPKAWTAVDKSAIPATKDGQVVLALTSTEINSGFANNLVIIKEKLQEKIDSKKYSVVNYALTTSNYKDFTKLDEKTVEFEDGDSTNLYVFEAKYNENTPKQKFIQAAKVCSETVYLMTIGVGVSTGNTSKYEDLVKSFKCEK